MRGQKGELRGYPYEISMDGVVTARTREGVRTFRSYDEFEATTRAWSVANPPAPPEAPQKIGAAGCMVAMIFVAAMLFLVWPRAGDRAAGVAPAVSEGARLYASTVVISVAATRHCPGVHLDNAGFARVREIAAVADSEKAALDAEVERYHGVVDVAIAGAGESAWCAAVWENYGPSGVRTLRR